VPPPRVVPIETRTVAPPAALHGPYEIEVGPASARTSELAAVIRLWDRPDPEGQPRVPPPPRHPGAVAISIDRDDAPLPRGEPAVLTRPPSADAPAEVAPPGVETGGVEVPDLDAEALLLELLERALRTEARRHGVALEPGALR
jgi:hypothetical protein